MVDKPGLQSINKSAMQTQHAVDQGKFKEATTLWSQTEDVISMTTHGVDFYNILKWGSGEAQQLKENDLNTSEYHVAISVHNILKLHLLRQIIQ